MTAIPSGTRFIGISQEADLTERKSSVNNAITQPFTIEEIRIPSQSEVAANGSTIATTTVLSYNVNLVSATAQNYAVRLPEPSLGGVVNVVNTSSVDVRVYAYDSNSYIYGYATGEFAIVPADGQMYTFTCVQNPNVGVWTFTTPAVGNTTTATVEYDITLTTDSSQTGVNQLTDGFIGATNTVISNVPYVCAIDVPNMSSALILWDAAFNGYNEIRVVKYELLSNIPVGDLNDINGPTPASILNIANAAALNTVGCSLAAATKDFNVSCGGSAGAIYQATYAGEYNVGYILSGGPIDIFPHISLPGEPGTTGQVYQKAVFNTNPAFERLFDDNGYPAKYYMLAAFLGSAQYPQHSAFPNGTSIEMKAKVTFELKV